jgi:hypothetical protein
MVGEDKISSRGVWNSPLFNPKQGDIMSSITKSPREEAKYQFEITRKSLIEQHSSLVEDAVFNGQCSERMAKSLKSGFESILSHMIGFKDSLTLMDMKE